MLGFWLKIPLWQRVAAALILGIVVGLYWGPGAEAIKWIGDLFIRSIKMLVVPLIFFSLVSGVAAIGDLKKLGNVGGRALLLFVATGLISVTLGLTMGTIFQPGVGLDISLPSGTVIPEPPSTSATEMILSLIPENPIMTMAQGQILPLIIFAMLFGIALLMAGEEANPLIRGVDAGAAVMQKMTMLVMELTPFGVFALMAWGRGNIRVGCAITARHHGCAELCGLLHNHIGRLPNHIENHCKTTGNRFLPRHHRRAGRRFFHRFVQRRITGDTAMCAAQPGRIKKRLQLHRVLGRDHQYERHGNVSGIGSPVWCAALWD